MPDKTIDQLTVGPALTDAVSIPFGLTGESYQCLLSDLITFILSTDRTFVGKVSTVGLQLRGGANLRIGEATLVAGTVVVANNTVTANTHIFLSRRVAGASPGTLTYTRSVGANFTINSSNGADTGTISYMLVEEY